MNYKLTKSSLSLEFAIYAILLVVVSYLIYVMNDDTQPLIGIFRPEYLIPCVIYSAIVVLISFSIFRIVKTVVQKGIAFGIAIVFGIPLGIYVLFHFTTWLFK